MTDNARGEYATDTIYDDTNVEQIKSIPATALHRNVDLRVVDADQQGYIRSYIIIPSTIYGIAKHALVDAGVSNAHSIQVPSMIRASLARKRAGVVGKGKALWPDVHIDDSESEFPSLCLYPYASHTRADRLGTTLCVCTAADLYLTLFDSILNNPDKTGHGWEGLYFGENGEHSWGQISAAIGQALVEFGISDNAEPTSFTVEEFVKYFGSEQAGWYNGTNSRARANRGRSIGWKPKHTTEDFLKSIRPEVEALVKKSQ